jgi:hypothetical protein
MVIYWLLRLQKGCVQRPREFPGVRARVEQWYEADGAYETLDPRVVQGQQFAPPDDVSHVLEAGFQEVLGVDVAGMDARVLSVSCWLWHVCFGRHEVCARYVYII